MLFPCEICGKAFTTKGNLDDHKRIHTKEKPYSCNICENSFLISSELTFHKRIHTGEKTYSCKTCKKSFYTSSNLTVHTRIHTGEKPYLCEICKKSYSSSSELSKHNKSVGHLKMSESNKNAVTPSASTSFVDCGEADIKLEIKEEETIDEDPLFIKMKADNSEETVKQEIEGDIQDTNSDDKRINTIDIVHHKIEI